MPRLTPAATAGCKGDTPSLPPFTPAGATDEEAAPDNEVAPDEAAMATARARRASNADWKLTGS